MNINSISLKRLLVPELLQFCSDSSTTIKSYDIVALDIDFPYNEFVALSDFVNTLYEPVKSNPQTEQLTILDERRDAAITGITTYLEGFTYHFDEAIKQNAKILFNHISSYGSGIARKNYPTETAIINNIIVDWSSKPELNSAVMALSLSAWQNELSEANTAFNNKYLERAKTDSLEIDATVSSKKVDLIAAWNSLSETIEAHYKLKFIKKAGFEPYENLIKNLNAIIDKYNLILANKTKKAATATKSADTTTNSSKTTD
jgi:hypothetical protein